MASTATPYGARPVGTLSASGSFTGKARAYNIASGYATSIFAGDFVKLVAAGVVEKDTGTATLTPIGIFVGCEYTDPNTGQLVQDQYWPASTVASDAVAFVIDDPFVLFEIQADGSIAQADLGLNAGVVQTAGSTTVKRSKNALDQSTAATTNTLPLRIVDFVRRADTEAGDSFTDVVAKFNAGQAGAGGTGHQLLDPLGI